MKMIVFSDIHYMNDRKCEEYDNRKLTEYSTILVNKIIDKVNNEIKPDVCLHLGDLIQDTKDREKDLENISKIWLTLKKFKVPFYTLIGNHELKTMNTRKEVLDILGYEKATFSVNISEYHLVFLGIGVNQNADSTNGGISRIRYIPDEDIEWLQNDLEENKNKNCIIFSHYGIAEDDMKGNFWFEKAIGSAVLSNRKEIKEILGKYNNILAVFCGHQHWTKKIIEDGISYYMVGSLIENINSNGIPDGVYLEVDVDNKNCNVTEHHIKLGDN